MEEAVKRLRQDETSTGLVDGTDNIRTDTVRVASVTRVEDDFSWGRMTVGNDDKWRYWGVYDGHVGWETSSILRDYLANYVNRKLDRLSAEELENPTAVQEAIKSAFVELDDEIISDGLAALYEPIPHAEAMCRMAPANSGSCALMALYDPDRSTLHVAGTGDSRAVLGRRQDNSEGNTWTATVLSVEHTGLNAEEKARIEAEHPGEDMFSTNGRFLSSEVTRSFGDNRRKWPAKALEDLEQDFLWSFLQPKYSNTAVCHRFARCETPRCIQATFSSLGQMGSGTTCLMKMRSIVSDCGSKLGQRVIRKPRS